MAGPLFAAGRPDSFSLRTLRAPGEKRRLLFGMMSRGNQVKNRNDIDADLLREFNAKGIKNKKHGIKKAMQESFVEEELFKFLSFTILWILRWVLIFSECLRSLRIPLTGCPEDRRTKLRDTLNHRQGKIGEPRYTPGRSPKRATGRSPLGVIDFSPR